MAKSYATILILVAFVLLCSTVWGSDRYPTNLMLVERSVKAAIDSMDVRPPAGRTPYLDVDAGSGGDASWLLDNVLKQRLLEMGWRIRASKEAQDSTPNPDGHYALRVQIIDLGLIYGRSWRRYLVAGKVVERVARVSLYYELADKARDQVLISSNARSRVNDVVPASLLPTLRSDKYAFANPTLEKAEWDKYLEAGLVITIVGVLIYLFYSNKTAS